MTHIARRPLLMIGFTTLLATTGLLIAAGAAESHRHRRRLEQIPTRIHVNGTRGKSSVARLIAAGLRESGLRTCCKTTGTLPQMILPDGSEFVVRVANRGEGNGDYRVGDQLGIAFSANAIQLLRD